MPELGIIGLYRQGDGNIFLWGCLPLLSRQSNQVGGYVVPGQHRLVAEVEDDECRTCPSIDQLRLGETRTETFPPKQGQVDRGLH